MKGATSYKDTKLGILPRKCIILIDGSNFYHKLKDLELPNLLSFNFTEFNKFISGSDQIISTTYYVGRIMTDGTAKTQELFDGQRRLLNHLKNHKVRYSLGYLMKNNGIYHEKGVDVNMAVDMLVATYEKVCGKIILISSDTDLLPAVLKSRQKGLFVEYVGFSHKPSLALISRCSESKLLSRDELVQFVEQKNPAKAKRRRRRI